ncbi:MAG: hypothetical protein JJE46_02820 [Acidimicrobiia bacterium]|nr:hypothetical protein [Acidimicrobiia bacterium]
MLWMERRVVTALAGPDDKRTGGAITEFVDSSFAAMPQHLRLGVVGESVLLGAYVALRYAPRPSDDDVLAAMSAWEHNPIGVIRQYARLLTSLVVFAQQELMPE